MKKTAHQVFIIIQELLYRHCFFYARTKLIERKRDRSFIAIGRLQNIKQQIEEPKIKRTTRNSRLCPLMRFAISRPSLFSHDDDSRASTNS